MARVSVYAPIAYLVLLLSCLALFSTVYRRRKVRRLVNLTPWFGPHDSRQIYESIKALPSTTGQKIPEKTIKAALLQRATENVRRIMVLQESKPALTELHQRGSIGDEIWTRFLAAEKLMDGEIMECAGEANLIKPGWAQVLFASAAEIVHNQRLREKLGHQVPAWQEQERLKWEAQQDARPSDDTAAKKKKK
ncbi:Sec62/63 complex, subunit Sec66 [Lipomyces japonicus]|uniref:Sec62/63 complex, subunit Sec66 n=1 Tax=Lipomyces japonicus TaxID=56871 RepID=UPI0034CDA21A